ncbi:DUF262 domain-containing protein [Corynebacterium phoceense]|nr:DUF262 domain-containing protein [Corynebacterium phoceense]
MDLQTQIDDRRQEIYTSKMTMSIGELANMYKDDELELQPEFQRLFRWSVTQKSRLIESLLLGIPLPSIFVYQRQDGVWDVIDGLQRMSTILEFMGLLRDAGNESLHTPSSLEATEYLPALEGCYWSENFGNPALSKEQQLLIKRAVIDVSVITRESDVNTKFDLFQRLNSGGSKLSDQEIRNAMLVMANRNLVQWIQELSTFEPFVEACLLTDKNLDEKYDQELVLRFILLSEETNEGLKAIKDLSDYLNAGSLELAKSFEREQDRLTDVFRNTFEIINFAFSEQEAFKRFDAVKGRFVGAFSVSAFEFVTMGIAANLTALLSLNVEDRNQFVRDRVKHMWAEPNGLQKTGGGVRANTRIIQNIPAAREYFNYENSNA